MVTSMTTVLIVGFGHHAKRIYYPIIRAKKDVRIVGVVDLKSEISEVNKFFKKNKYSGECLFLNSKKIKDNSKLLTEFAKKLSVEAVVISCPPEYHYEYGAWALKNGFHVLMDKPIHVEPKASHNPKAAKQIHKKYQELDNLLKVSRVKYPDLVFEIHTQRRVHLAYQTVKDTLKEVYEKTGCPITYYYAFHNDGQWRMPSEIKNFEYHGFKNGTGKASHSGYHFYDLFNWFTDFYREDLKIDTLKVSSTPIYPSDNMAQINSKVLKKVFKKDVKNDFDFKDYGEVDIFSTIELISKDKVITHAQIDLLHSGLSARSWFQIGDRDLYKQNGRLRHEQHYIAMGPFLAVSLTSWQGMPFGREPYTNSEIYNPGHELNLDIKIFKNNKVVGGNALEEISLKDIYEPYLKDYSRGHQEDARKEIIDSFFDAVKFNWPTESSLESHEMSSRIMEQVYLSLSTKKATKVKI
jgi:predicted dehydrogenase